MVGRHLGIMMLREATLYILNTYDKVYNHVHTSDIQI